jgi:transcriptional regulator|nr:MAG TPA: hypothetical protein [Caudoviricetes sp.]
MQDTLKERLIEFIKSQGLSQGKFEKRMNFSNGYVNSISKGIGGDKLQRIIGEFPQLNSDWLLYGRGNMLNNEKEVPAGNIEMSREVFDKISQLIDTVCSQQGTIADQQKLITEQHRTIGRLSTSVESGAGVRAEGDAGCAAAK